MFGKCFRVSLALCFLPVLEAGAQSTSTSPSKELTIEAIFGGELSAPAPSQARWMPDGRVSFFLPAGSGGGGREFRVFDPATGSQTVLVSSDALRDMAPAAGEASKEEREITRRTRFGVPDYQWAPDGKSVLFTSSGHILLYDLSTGTAKGLALSKSGVVDPKFSPDGSQVAFVYQHDVWTVPVAGGGEKQLTFGGRDLIFHGDLDWVYPEELGVRTGYHWSPDSRIIAFLELDETLVPIYPITEELARQATFDLQRYPKPGDPNPRVRVGFVDVASGRTAWIDRAAEYIPRIDWVDGKTVCVQLLNRGQDRLELVLADPATGSSRSMLTETDPHWVNVTNDLRFLAGGKKFLWTSERTGFRHIYLATDGGGEATLRPLTEGEWQVSSIEGVDEAKGLVYFAANRDNPVGQDLYRVKLDGSGLERLTRESGTHAIDMSPKATAYLDSYSSMTDPGRTTFHNLGTRKDVLFHEEPRLADYALVKPERQLLDAPDGAKVGLLLMKPAHLEPGKKYPLVAYLYGMPGFPTIRDSWGGSRYLFHQFLVQQGFVVAQIDDRTSSVWGHKFAALGDHNIGPVAVKDHEVAVEYLTSLPYVDSEHTGVWGWSGGGFTTTYHMTHTKLFKFGVAGAPVTDWHLYDSIYTERYMGTPAEDPEAYERTSSIEGAKNYGGRLLLIFATHDDNVHPQNSIQLIQALIDNRQQFDVMIYPDQTHGIRGQNELVHLWTMVYEHLERNLK
jgi:dipeptidyl-peptidase 4